MLRSSASAIAPSGSTHLLKHALLFPFIIPLSVGVLLGLKAEAQVPPKPKGELFSVPAVQPETTAETTAETTPIVQESKPETTSPLEVSPSSPRSQSLPSRGSTSNSDALLQTAQDQYAQGDFTEALKTLETALQSQTQPQDRAQTLNLIGLVQERLQQFEPARSSYQQALDTYTKLKASQPQIAQQGEARTLNNLGSLYAANDQVSEALGFMERSLGLFRRLKNRESEAVTLRNLGNLYLRSGRGEEAIKALQASLQIEIELERPVETVTLLDRLSSLYLSAGAPGEALAALQQAYQIVEPSDDLESKLALLTRIAQLYEGIRRPDKAVERYQAALNLVEKAPNLGDARRPLEGRLRGRIATVFAESGENKRALAQYEKALAIAQELNNSGDTAELLIRMADVQRRSEDYDSARRNYQEALTLVQPLEQPIIEGRLLSGLAVIAKEQQQWNEAEDFAQQALAAQQKSVESETEQKLQQAGQAVTLNLLGDVYQQQKQYERAAAAYQQSLAKLGPQGNVMLQGANLTHLGAMEVALGKAENAVKPLQDAIALWEAVGLESAEGRDRDLVEESYRLLTEAFLQQDKTGEALAAVERRRSRLFRTLLDLRQSSNQPPTKSLSLQQIQAIAARQQTTLVVYDVANTTLEDPVATPAKPLALRIWTVAPGSSPELTTVELNPSQQALLQSIGLGKAKTGLSAQQWSQEELKAWSDVLLQTIRTRLPQASGNASMDTAGNAVTIVVPTELQRLPWAALPLGRQTFLEQHLLTVLPTLQLVAGSPDEFQSRARAGKALIVGDPATGGTRSPQAAQEAKAVAKLLGTEALTGEAATVRAIASDLPQASLVHLTVPQLNVEGVGEALALASEGRGQELKGITPGDLLTLNLKADLVVLHGLLGNVDQPSSAEMSMAQAFRAAGAKAVVQSLGSASPEAGQTLMQRFYINLQSGQTTVVALRQAMLSVRQDYPEASDWAGFTLLGALGQTVNLSKPQATPTSSETSPTASDPTASEKPVEPEANAPESEEAVPSDKN